ncbi:MAG TPA: hypothetical protein VK203_10660 [Nostocaceae cyanobacterium]|nr:hypothetical protein [Nostocaceae cyanobacterium]
MELRDGKTEKVSRRRDNSRTQGESESMGTLSDSSQEPWINQISISGEDSEWRDHIRKLATNGNSNLGKILERLHRIEQKHIAYVKSHQQKLKAQLEESTTSETEFTEEIRDLERSILELIEQKADV